MEVFEDGLSSSKYVLDEIPFLQLGTQEDIERQVSLFLSYVDRLETSEECIYFLNNTERYDKYLLGVALVLHSFGKSDPKYMGKHPLMTRTLAVIKRPMVKQFPVVWRSFIKLTTFGNASSFEYFLNAVKMPEKEAEFISYINSNLKELYNTFKASSSSASKGVKFGSRKSKPGDWF